MSSLPDKARSNLLGAVKDLYKSGCASCENNRTFILGIVHAKDQAEYDEVKRAYLAPPRPSHTCGRFGK